jgi:threonine dehydratase
MRETLRLVPATPLEPALPDLTSRASVYLKREDVHELGAFKWRGALPALERYRREGAIGVVTESTGNHAVATAWAADSLGLSATVFVPEGASRTKLAKLDGLGAAIVVTGADFDETKERAAAHAEQAGLPFFEDGAEPAQLDGYAVIGDEILDQLDDEPAAVVVPVGNGALLAGIGRTVGKRSPGTQRVGVVSSGAPVMARSWKAGLPVQSALSDTIADGLAVRIAIPIAVQWLLEDADEMLEVSEAEITAAVVAFDDAGIRAEAAAAAALAALPYVDAGGPVVLVVTGRNIDDELLARCRASVV